jgi:Protein of unknown function (DUF2726)
MEGPRVIPVLVNPKEQQADRLLQEVSDLFGDRLLAKVGLIDAIDPIWAAYPVNESGYAQRAHLDFVMVNAETSVPIFAVELDGSQHSTDPNQRWRDAVKDKLCEAAGLPLIRINSDFAKEGGRFVVLKYLCEIFYRARGFEGAQASGQIRDDEPFVHFLFLDQTDDGHLLFGSFDAEARLALLNLWKANRIPRFAADSWHGDVDASGNVRSEEYLGVGDNRVIVGSAQVRHFRNFGISSGELAEEIALVELYENTKRWLAGEPVAMSGDDFGQHFRRFVAECNPYCSGSTGTPGESNQRVPYPPFRSGKRMGVEFDAPT